MQDIKMNDLDKIYSCYGFKKGRSSSDKIGVYKFKSGHFNNAEIVPLSEDVNCSEDFEQYTKSGYACHIRKYRNIKEVEEALFEGFFSLKITRDKFSNEYDYFYKKQTEALGVPYRYVNPPYHDSSGEQGDHKASPLVSRILTDLKSPGSRLVILEAAAGYGKTCTSFEVLSGCLHEFNNRIPFFVELSRNRQAKIFRYVLLDEANRVFPGLKEKNRTPINWQISHRSGGCCPIEGCSYS